MVGRTDALAHGSPFRCSFLHFILLFCLFVDPVYIYFGDSPLHPQRPCGHRLPTQNKYFERFPPQPQYNMRLQVRPPAKAKEPIMHKKDDLELQQEGNRYIWECCVLIISETWLNLRIPDACVELAGHSLHRWDRTKDSKSLWGARYLRAWCLV